MASPGCPPLTQSGRSKVKYSWIFLFNNGINIENPFSVAPLSFFADVDFPWSFIEGEMSSNCRAEIHQFQNLPGNYRIFGKIEKGNLHNIPLINNG